MKSKEKKQLVGKTAPELTVDVQKLTGDIANLLLDKTQGKLKNTSSLTNKRKEIAIIKTIMREKEMQNESI